MTDEKQTREMEDIWSFEKKALKGIGKIALTALAPPIGLPTWFKTFGARSLAATLGVVGSLVYPMSISTQNQVYESVSGNISVSTDRNIKYENLSRAIPSLIVGGFASPILLHYETADMTGLRDGEESYRVFGHDVISFDEQAQSYRLNFNEQSEFDVPNMDYISLNEVQTRVANLEGELERLTSQGNIADARQVAEELNVARANYDFVSTRYERFREAYENVVQMMNDELNDLRTQSQGEQ